MKSYLCKAVCPPNPPCRATFTVTATATSTDPTTLSFAEIRNAFEEDLWCAKMKSAPIVNASFSRRGLQFVFVMKSAEYRSHDDAMIFWNTMALDLEVRLSGLFTLGIPSPRLECGRDRL